MDIPLLEWVGYVGSVLVAVSLTMSSIKKLRWYNLVGAAVFSFYGFAIGSLPVGLLNLFIVVTNIYYLIRMGSQSEAFKSILVDLHDPYLKYFLDFHQQDIRRFFPAFDPAQHTQKSTSGEPFAMLVLRNASVAGVMLGQQQGDTLELTLDYVTAPYRDLKPGEFVYSKKLKSFEDRNIRRIESITTDAVHSKYLLRMGFTIDSTSEPNRYSKILS